MLRKKNIDLDFYLKAVEDRKTLLRGAFTRYVGEFDYGAEIANDYILNYYYKKIEKLLAPYYYTSKGELKLVRLFSRAVHK